MDRSEIAAAEPTDHRTGLVLFGVLDLLVAVGYLIKTLALAFISIAGANPRPKAILAGELPVSALLSLLPAASFMAIGIGSILGRRWARSLSVVFSSLWVAFGTVTTAAILLCLPRFIAATGEKPPLVACGGLALFGIVLPGAYALFYRSPGVKASCEWLDPQERWTDLCPGPVLAAIILLIIGADLELGIGFSSSRQALYFGHLLGGGARLGLLAAAAIQLGVAWNMIRRKRWAWIAAVAIMAVRIAGTILIVRNLSIERLEGLAVSRAKIGPRDAAMLQALKSLHPASALMLYILALSALALAIVIWAGKWFRLSPIAVSHED